MKGELMKTYIAYFDETGDDGVTINSSESYFIQICDFVSFFYIYISMHFQERDSYYL